MAKYLSWKGEFIKFITLSVFILFLSGISTLYAQRGHVVLLDTILIAGYIKDLPVENNTAIYYKKYGNDVFVRFTVNEVSEFSIKNRYFYRREIYQDGVRHPIFLERLITDKKTVSLYKLNDKPVQFFIEKDSVLQRLENIEQLLEVFSEPGLKYLIASTKIKEQELLYLFKTASEKKFKPRTFTNTVVLTPFVGVSSISHTVKMINLKEDLVFNSLSPSIGLNIEAFLNFERNLSLNFGPQFLSFQNHKFYATPSTQPRTESDIFIEYRAVQLPVSVKYYHDVKPQKLRFFGELGFITSNINRKKAISYDATITGNEVQVRSHGLLISDRHSGFVIGIGAERYLYSHRGLVFGLTYSRMAESNKNSIEQIQLSSGFKF